MQLKHTDITRSPTADDRVRLYGEVAYDDTTVRPPFRRRWSGRPRAIIHIPINRLYSLPLDWRLKLGGRRVDAMGHSYETDDDHQGLCPVTRVSAFERNKWQVWLTKDQAASVLGGVETLGVFSESGAGAESDPVSGK